MANLPYYEQKDIENIQKLRTMLKELPPFCTEYFRGIEPRTSTRTRIAYAYDLSVFFDFLKKENPVFSKMDLMYFRKGVVALPVHAEPTGIEVDVFIRI